MDEQHGARPLEIRCFPDRDEQFLADVQETVARSRKMISDGHRLLESVRESLAKRYPAVVIRERDELADLGGGPSRWYVYRDGRIA